MEMKNKNKNKWRRGPLGAKNMRYFKIPLCRNFVWKVGPFFRTTGHVSVLP